MAMPRREPITDERLQGFKYFKKSLPLDRPHDAAVARDRAGKPTLRTLEMIRFCFIGWAELDELEAHLAGLQPVQA